MMQQASLSSYEQGMEHILKRKINIYSKYSRQYIFNTLSNTKINELVGKNMLKKQRTFLKCFMMDKNEPHKWFDNPDYNFTISCQSDKQPVSVIIKFILERKTIGGYAKNIGIKYLVIKNFNSNNNKYCDSRDNIESWAENITKIISGKNGRISKSQKNKWVRKRLTTVLGVLATGAALGGAIAGGILITQSVRQMADAAQKVSEESQKTMDNIKQVSKKSQKTMYDIREKAKDTMKKSDEPMEVSKDTMKKSNELLKESKDVMNDLKEDSKKTMEKSKEFLEEGKSAVQAVKGASDNIKNITQPLADGVSFTMNLGKKGYELGKDFLKKIDLFHRQNHRRWLRRK